MCICFPYSHSVFQIELQKEREERKTEGKKEMLDKWIKMLWKKGKEKTLTMLPFAHPLK